VREGDVQIDPDKQAAAPPPSLRNPGETLPTDHTTTGVMRPVQMPKPHTPDQTDAQQTAAQPGANPDEQQQTPQPPASGQASQSGTAQQPSTNTTKSQSAPASTQPAPPAGASQFIASSSAAPSASSSTTQPN
jgi:hypothetical protein